MTNDLVSDMLTRIRNASLARHSFTAIRYNKINLGILKILKSEGYIQDYLLENEESISKVQIKVLLKYKGWWIKKPLFSTIQRISKPGKRVFSGYGFLMILCFQKNFPLFNHAFLNALITMKEIHPTMPKIKVISIRGTKNPLNQFIVMRIKQELILLCLHLCN
jgi:ribosomal protein S8